MIKFDKLFELLENNGYTAQRIRSEKILGQAAYYGMKNGTRGIDTGTINKLCALLCCQPGDLMEYVPDDEK